MDKNRLWGPARELAYHPRAARVRCRLARFVTSSGASARSALRRSSNVSADGRSAVVLAELTRQVPVERIRAAVAGVARAHPAADHRGDRRHHRRRGANRPSTATCTGPSCSRSRVTLLVLLFAFGALSAALVPVLLALTAVVAGFGLLGPISQVFPLDDSVKTVVLLIGMAVGVDYALFYVVRSREERSRGATDRTRRSRRRCRTSGRTVIVSGATVAIAMAGMYLVGVRIFERHRDRHDRRRRLRRPRLRDRPARDPAPARPADRPRPDPVAAARAHRRRSRFWSAVVDRVLRRPLVAAVLATALLLALAYPALSLRISEPSDLALTAQSEPALKALADVRRAFPSAGETADRRRPAPAAAQGQLRQRAASPQPARASRRASRPPVDSIRTGSTAPAARPRSSCR